MNKFQFQAMSALFIFSLFTCTTTLPMHASRFSRFCKWVNLGIVFVPSFYSAYKYANRDRELDAQLDDADPVTTALIREQLKKVGVNDPDQVKIKEGKGEYGKDLNMFCAGHNMMLVPSECCALISRPLEVSNEEREIKLQRIMSIAQHEGSHIKHHDIRNDVLVIAAVPFATHPILKLGGSAIRNICKIKPAVSKIRLLARNIGAGWLKMQINVHLSAAYSRHIEQRADDEVVDPQGLIDFLEATYNSVPEKIRWIHRFDILHPYILKRIARLKKRLPETTQEDVDKFSEKVQDPKQSSDQPAEEVQNQEVDNELRESLSLEDKKIFEKAIESADINPMYKNMLRDLVREAMTKND